MCQQWKLFHHYLLVAIMTASRRLVNLGKKLCLFVYYVEHINNKQWVAKEATTFNGDGESRTVHDNIRRRIQEQWASLLVFWILFQKSVGGAC
jgi:hypothetical protein